MIAAVRGVLRAKGHNYLILEVGAVDLVIRVPASVLSSDMLVGDRTELYTSLYVREAELSLFGFGSTEERDLFEMLIQVNGVGPRSALSLLSICSTDVLMLAIAEGKHEVLARAPGIGMKTAQRIVLQLQDKVDTSRLVREAPLSDVDGDVIAALTTLGFSVVEAQRAVQLLPKDATTLEERLSLALARFGAGR